MSYKVEIIERKDPIVQLEPSKSSIKDLFSDQKVWFKWKGFKYQITSSMNKLNLLQFILIHSQKQQYITDLN